MKKRKVDLVIVSDTHLGTYGCHAEELHRYLKSIQPGTLILNGDIIDIWAYSKSFFPRAHMQVIREIIKMLTNGTTVYYLTGNHDEMLRRFSDLSLGNFHLRDKVILNMDGKKAWIFHGDVFDMSVKHAKWLARLGGKGYDILIRINRLVNHVLKTMGKPKYSISKRVKDGVKRAVKYVSDFEVTAVELAIREGYDYVICGHIHQPQIKEIIHENGKVTYLNSGDWIENLTALEYQNGIWNLIHYEEMEHLIPEVEEEAEADQQVQELIEEFLPYLNKAS